MKYFPSVLAIILIAGCGNLQTNNDNRQYIYSKDGSIRYPDKPSFWVKNCPLFTPPESLPAPSVPIAELKALRTDQVNAREKLFIAYIEVLRTHISTQSKANVDAYTAYVNACNSE